MQFEVVNREQKHLEKAFKFPKKDFYPRGGYRINQKYRLPRPIQKMNLAYKLQIIFFGLYREFMRCVKTGTFPI